MYNSDYDINVPHELVNLHYSVWRLEHVLNILINKCLASGISISIKEVEEAGRQALLKVQSKFPEREIVIRDPVINVDGHPHPNG